MTPHINAKKDEIASTVLMAGDPLRAKFYANKYLTDVKLVSDTRNMLMFTGFYNDKKVTIAGSGMGQPSMGIYSYELFKFYDVKRIIRIGTAGSYKKDLKMYEVFLVSEAFSESSKYSELILGEITNIHYPSKKLNEEIIEAAQKRKIKLNVGRVNSSDSFYILSRKLKDTISITQADCTEMESFALFTNAKKMKREAATILTICDNLVTGEETSAKEREKGFFDMIELALQVI